MMPSPDWGLFSDECTIGSVTSFAQPVAQPTAVDPGVLAQVGAALADGTRCAILARLATGPAYPGDLATGLGTTRANVSNHLACLRSRGLVLASPEGRRVAYRLANPALADALRVLVAATEARP